MHWRLAWFPVTVCYLMSSETAEVVESLAAGIALERRLVPAALEVICREEQSVM